MTEKQQYILTDKQNYKSTQQESGPRVLIGPRFLFLRSLIL
jgi:hypothetical protein